LPRRFDDDQWLPVTTHAGKVVRRVERNATALCRSTVRGPAIRNDRENRFVVVCSARYDDRGCGGRCRWRRRRSLTPVIGSRSLRSLEILCGHGHAVPVRPRVGMRSVSDVFPRRTVCSEEKRRIGSMERKFTTRRGVRRRRGVATPILVATNARARSQVSSSRWCTGAMTVRSCKKSTSCRLCIRAIVVSTPVQSECGVPGATSVRGGARAVISLNPGTTKTRRNSMTVAARCEGPEVLRSQVGLDCAASRRLCARLGGRARRRGSVVGSA